MAARKRRATVCRACGYPSWSGMVCRDCKRYYGTAEDAIAGSAMARRFEGATLDQVVELLGELCDVIVPDWPGPSLQQLVYSSWSAPPISGADQKTK